MPKTAGAGTKSSVGALDATNCVFANNMAFLVTVAVAPFHAQTVGVGPMRRVSFWKLGGVESGYVGRGRFPSRVSAKKMKIVASSRPSQGVLREFAS